jgi:hypothetical protein
MAYHGHRSIGSELEDTVYACGRCGGELIRTTVCSKVKADGRKSAA